MNYPDDWWQFSGYFHVSMLEAVSDYFEINATHTDLISHPVARRVVEYIISLERAEEYPEEALVGFNQYGHAWIDECSPADRFVIIGKRISELETPGVLDCKCGDGICGIGETIESCPADCMGSLSAWLCPWAPVAIPLLLLAAVVLTLVYLVTKHLQKKDISDAWRIMDYIVVILGVVLLVLGMVICRYLSLLAVLVLLFIIVLLLLDLFVPGKKRKKKVKKSVKKKK